MVLPAVTPVSATWVAIPPDIICSLNSMAAVIAPEFKITGKKKIALTMALPGNFLFRSIAMNKLKNVIRGTSISMFRTEVVSTCLKEPCTRNA